MKTSHKCTFFSLPQKKSGKVSKVEKTKAYFINIIFTSKKVPKHFFFGKTVFLYNMTLLSSEKTKIPFFWRPSFIKNDAYIFIHLIQTKTQPDPPHENLTTFAMSIHRFPTSLAYISHKHHMYYLLIQDPDRTFPRRQAQSHLHGCSGSRQLQVKILGIFNPRKPNPNPIFHVGFICNKKEKRRKLISPRVQQSFSFFFYMSLKSTNPFPDQSKLIRTAISIFLVLSQKRKIPFPRQKKIKVYSDLDI